MRSKKASAFPKAAPSGVNEVYGSAIFGNISSHDQGAFNRHVDYVHWNPVKHEWVRRVADWPHSSFHAFRRRGMYPEYWGG